MTVGAELCEKSFGKLLAGPREKGIALIDCRWPLQPWECLRPCSAEF